MEECLISRLKLENTRLHLSLHLIKVEHVMYPIKWKVDHVIFHCPTYARETRTGNTRSEAGLQQLDETQEHHSAVMWRYVL